MQSPQHGFLNANNFRELEEQHWTVASALNEDLDRLSHFAQSQWEKGEFKQAAVGRGSQQAVHGTIRNDSIYWLSAEQTPPFLVQLKSELNREFFLGIDSLECHFAHYSAGQFYEEHVDQPKAQSFLHGERVISFVLYLNKQWQAAQGGQLRIRNAQPGPLPEFQIIEPRWGQMVLFKSDTVLHQVLPTHNERWSLTGWFRRS